MLINFVYALSVLNGASVQAVRVVLVLYALRLDAQPLTIGLLSAAYSVFPMLLAVTAGKLADRFGTRWLLIFGALGSGLGMLVPYFVPGLPAVFIAGAMSGLSAVFYNISTQNLVGLLSAPEARARNFSNFALTVSAANLMGPLIAGFSMEHFGHVDACLHLALFTLVPVVLLGIWGNQLPGGTSSGKTASGGVRAMLADPNTRRVLATGSLLQAAMNLYQFYMPVYAHSLDLSPSSIGMVLAMFPAAAFAVRLILPRLIAEFKVDNLLACAFYTGSLSLLLIPFLKSPVMLGILSFIFGLGMGCSQPIINMLMFSSSRDGRSGEALGLKTTVNQLTKLVSPVIFGAIASAFGLPPMFWTNALMMGLGGLISRSRNPIRSEP